MIKTENGHIEANGTLIELMADLSVIIRNLYKDIAEETDESFAKETINEAVKAGFLSDEEITVELKKRKKEEIEKALEVLTNALSKAVNKDE